MNNITVIGIIFILAVVTSFLYQKKVQNDLLKYLVSLKSQRKREEFYAVLNSNRAKFNFSKFTIEFMKFNYECDFGDYQIIKEQYLKFKDIRLNSQNLIALNLKMFHCSIQAKDYKFSSSIKDILVSVLKKKKDEQSKIILGEVEQIHKIYVEKDTSLIPDLESSFEECDNNNIKALLSFRLAKLYHFINDERKVNKYLLFTKEFNPNPDNVKTINFILQHHQELD